MWCCIEVALTFEKGPGVSSSIKSETVLASGELGKSFLRHYNGQEENFKKFFVLISRMKSIVSPGVDFHG